jgi:hypothetical protein
MDNFNLKKFLVENKLTSNSRFLKESTIVVLSDDNFKTTIKGKQYTVEYNNHDEGDSITLKGEDGDKIQGTVTNISPDGDLTVNI